MSVCFKPAGTAISLRDVRFGFAGGESVISVRSLNVETGESIFIQGPSGCGKSTLLGLIGGVLKPGSGDVSVLGQSVSKMRAAARDRFRADHIGFVFQMFNLLPYLSITDNVILPCRFSALRRKRIAEQGESLPEAAARLLARLGVGDQRLRGRPVSKLSIGQQQRVAVARALIGRPEVLIADEPTSSLDVAARSRFIELLLEESGGAGSTVVFVSHDSQLARYFDRVVALPDINRVRLPEDTAYA